MNWFKQLNDLFGKQIVASYFLIVFGFSFMTYFFNYQYPNASIWDEVYHISSSEKYLQDTFFMEAHPPLGKLFIALGEKIINPNDEYSKLNPVARFCLSQTPADTDGVKQTLLQAREASPGAIDKSSFLSTESISEYPKLYSFCGVRLFPVLFGIMGALAFFLLIYFLTRNPHLALIFSSFYVFDNALLIQSRAAMLDSIQFFFILASLAYAAWVTNQVKRAENNQETDIKPLISTLFRTGIKPHQYAILGIIVGLGVAVKSNGSIMLLLPIIVIAWEIYFGQIWLRPGEVFKLGKNQLSIEPAKTKDLINSILQIVIKLAFAGLAVAIVYLSVFAVHFNLTKSRVGGEKYEALYTNRYNPTPEQRQIIETGQGGRLGSFVDQMRDNWDFMDRYHKGVPKLDLTKADENGSYPSNWPVMNRTISFRWETADGVSYRYSYLIGNPLIWLICLLAVVFSVVLILGRLLFGTPIRNGRLFSWIFVFTLLYSLYMGALLQVIQVRVLYLYHYLVALIFSMVLSGLMAAYLLEDIRVEPGDEDKMFNNRNIFYGILTIMVMAVIAVFIFYSPFTYYQPLNSEQFKQRALFDFWLMRPAK